ncbi:MAG: hypothetical protein DSM106950_46100 [Stigonema ocellatum SAG 48.90 = DSM 106950]|nr:hypothetical protein [Stigonema ocellatum SAG 48.90 = DSM 106950]
MESTLFTALTVSEEASLSGGATTTSVNGGSTSGSNTIDFANGQGNVGGATTTTVYVTKTKTSK